MDLRSVEATPAVEEHELLRQRHTALEIYLASWLPEYRERPEFMARATKIAADASDRLRLTGTEIPPIDDSLVFDLVEDIKAARVVTGTDAPSAEVTAQLAAIIEQRRSQGDAPERHDRFPYTDQTAMVALAEAFRAISDRADEGIGEDIQAMSRYEIITSVIELVHGHLGDIAGRIDVEILLGELFLLPSFADKKQKPWDKCSKEVKNLLIKIARELVRTIPGATLAGDKINSTEGPVITLP
ncbi:MAG: hypothetical protein WCT32_01970 [Patescibacteria group bacterium]|jgi:hypothetical protein